MDDSNIIQHNEKEEQERTTVLKKATIEAMRKSLGVVTQACKIVDIDRSTYYAWYKTDEDFKRECDDCSEIALDFAESKLYKQIDDNIPTSTIFFLKCRGKQRGYVERTEQDFMSGGQPLAIFLDANKSTTDTVQSTSEPTTETKGSA